MKKEINNIKRIIVHGGVFHADDVMAVAIMKYIIPDIIVVRKSNITPDDQDNNTIIADVGDGEYDHHKDKKYDEDGNIMAACGLLFNDYWDCVFPNEPAAKSFYNNIIIPIQNQDNGISMNPLSYFIKSFAPTWDDDISMDEAFNEAVNVCLSFVKREVKKAKSKEALTSVINEIKNEDGNIVVLEKFIPIQAELINSTKEFIIYPSLRGGYNIQTIPAVVGQFGSKVPLPEEWLFNTPKGCTFVHTGLFIAAFTSLDEAINAAKTIK